MDETVTSSETTVSKQGFTDGAPLDRVQYLEAKLILKPDRFTSVKSFRDFGKIVKRTAKKIGVGYTEDEAFNDRPQIREINFFDTSDFAFYTNAFILRRRVSFVDGFPEGDPEIVFTASSSKPKFCRSKTRWAATAFSIRIIASSA
jgi:hypothetical protein